MKRIHIPTLIMHLLLLALARITLGDYPDFFLGLSILVLILHAGWSLESQRSFLLSHSLGLVLYLLAQPLGIITFEGGFWSMGSEFSWLFYGIALVCSLVLETVIAVVRRLLQKV